MKMAECFQKGLLKRTSPDMENALRSLDLSKSNIEDAVENMSIHRYRVVAISSYSSLAGAIQNSSPNVARIQSTDRCAGHCLLFEHEY